MSTESQRPVDAHPRLDPVPGKNGETGTRVYRENRRVAYAVLLAALVAVGLLHWLLVQRFERQGAARGERAALITLHALAAVTSGAEAASAAETETTDAADSTEPVAEAAAAPQTSLQNVIAAWQKEHPNVRAIRVVDMDERSIDASTFPADGAVPRRMERPEKPLYDLGQELRGNVETNREEGAKRLDEVAAQRRPDGTLLLAAPVEVDGSVTGMVQALIAPEAVAVAPPTPLFAIAFGLAPFVVLFALSFALPRSRVPLRTLAAAILLLTTLFAYRQWALGSLSGGARAAEQRFAEKVRKEADIARRVAPGAEAAANTWDADLRRVPRKIDPDRAVAGEKQAVANASYGIGVLSLLILLFVALGLAAHTGRALRRNKQAYAFVAPAMVGMLILVFFPFIYGVVLSFTSQNVYSVNKPLSEIWVGFENYASILGDFNPVRHTDAGRQANYSNFYYTFAFTVLWTITNVAIGVGLGLFLALLLNTKNLRFKTVYRVLLILPWAVPNYMTALIFKGMFHQQFGAINQFVQLLGMDPIAWFDRPLTSFATVLTTNGWLSFPFMMVVSLGALQSIPADLYEAARVDGATRWQQFRSITLPSLRPALVPAVILSVIWTFNMFNIIYLVSAGMPAGSTEILITQAYKLAFEQYRYGYAAAYSTVIFGILLIYGVFQNRVSKGTEAIA